MEQALHIIALWTHILGIALFVGPQFFLAFGWAAASRHIVDVPMRIDAMRVITRRFLYVGGAGLGLILVAGLYLLVTWRDFYAADPDVAFTDFRFGVVFNIKMTLLAIMLTVVGIHTFVVGPRLIDLLDAEARGKPVSASKMRTTRRISMSLSVSGLALALTIMALGTMLATTAFSIQRI